jgi:PleD family two-component response regulator
LHAKLGCKGKKKKKKTILAVDDDLIALEILRNFLSPSYDVITSMSAADATIEMSKKLPDLILLDIEMPDISGFEFLHTIKKNPRFMRIPVLIVSAHSDEEFVIHAKKCGASGLVAKPIIREDFFQKIEYAFEHPVKNIFDL